MRPRPRFPKAYADVAQKQRVLFGFLLLFGFVLVAQPSLRSIWIGMPVSILGLMLRAWAAGHLAKDRQLAITGPYAYIRNPLYLGTLVTAAGFLIAARSPVLAFCFAIVFVFVYLPAVQLEEEHLYEIFPEYAGYAAGVHRFVPVLKRQKSKARFSWARYGKNEEYKALLGFLLALGWLIWKGRHFHTL